MNKFINRKLELAQLESQYVGESGRLVVLYGRRRLGKTALLRQFAKAKPHCYFMALSPFQRDKVICPSRWHLCQDDRDFHRDRLGTEL
jgi:AAA+ ATPase superfamily predicted ATPase